METANPPIYSDNQTVLSDLTDMNDTNTATSFVIEDKIDEIILKLNAELNKLNADSLKEKAKDMGMPVPFKVKKTRNYSIIRNHVFETIAGFKG